MRHVQFVAVALLAGLLGGCSATPPSSFYTLGPGAALERTGAAIPINIIVGPVTVPELVDRPQIVTRVGVNEVRLNEFARWAEPLKSDIARTVAADLSQLLGTDVNVFDSGEYAAPTWRVRVDVMRIESEPAVAVAVDALWVIQPSRNEPPIGGRSIVREVVTEPGYAPLVAAHDRALATVSRDIAAAIRAHLAR
jgi:uncharacterized lipoprotein YmbA